MDEKDRIIEELRKELAGAKAREEENKDSRSAMLYMLEDLNSVSERLEESRRQWEATFEAITDPLFIHDSRLKLVRANRAYQGYAGMPLSDMIGRPYYEVFPKMDGPFKKCAKDMESMEGVISKEAEEVPLPQMGKVFNVLSYPMKDAHGAYMFSVHLLQDITEAKRMDERIRAEMAVTESLLSIAEAVAKTKDMNKLMEHLVGASAGIMRAEVCAGYLKAEGGKDFAPSHAFGLQKAALPFFRTEPLKGDAWYMKKVFEEKGPLFLNAPFNEIGPMHPFDAFDGFEAMLLMPLTGVAGPLGLLAVFYWHKKTPTDAEVRVAKGIMHQASTAVEEAMLYKETIDREMDLSHKIETIKVMNEIDRSILSTLNPAEVLDTVVRLIAKIIPCDRATIALVDRARGGFVFHAGVGITMPRGTFVPFGDTSATEVALTGRAEYVSDISEKGDILPLEKKFLKEGFVSHLRVPVVSKGTVSALLNVGAKRPGVFTPDMAGTIENLASQIGVALENSRLITDLEDLFFSTIKVLSNTIDAKSPWTHGHSERVTGYAVKIGSTMGLKGKELKDLELSGLLHDIGKLGTYESVLDKPGALTPDEVGLVKQHPGKGALIIEPIRQLKDIVPGIKYHHEFFDGTGYPEGLKGGGIPLMARILAVADTVDAMGADRPYRKGRPMDAIVAELKRCAGAQFDPDVVDAFFIAMGFKGELSA